MTRWKEIPTDIGHALWNTLRARMAQGPKDVTLYESCTDNGGRFGLNPYCLTVVGTVDGTTPLLKCESRGVLEYDSDGNCRANWTEHHFYVPNGQEKED